MGLQVFIRFSLVSGILVEVSLKAAEFPYKLSICLERIFPKTQ